MRAASKAAQLALFNAIPQRGMLAAQLVSHYVGQAREVTEAVREMCRWVTQNRDAGAGT